MKGCKLECNRQEEKCDDIGNVGKAAGKIQAITVRNMVLCWQNSQPKWHIEPVRMTRHCIKFVISALLVWTMSSMSVDKSSETKESLDGHTRWHSCSFRGFLPAIITIMSTHHQQHCRIGGMGRCGHVKVHCGSLTNFAQVHYSHQKQGEYLFSRASAHHHHHCPLTDHHCGTWRPANQCRHPKVHPMIFFLSSILTNYYKDHTSKTSICVCFWGSTNRRAGPCLSSLSATTSIAWNGSGGAVLFCPPPFPLGLQ